MMFSQESSQAIFEMGNVELSELKTSRIQCLSGLHYMFRGTIICACGKHIRPDQEMIRRINAFFFEILKAPYFRTSVVTARNYKQGLTYDRNTTTKQETQYDVRERAKENSRRFGIDVKMTRPAGSLNLPLVVQMLVPRCPN